MAATVHSYSSAGRRVMMIQKPHIISWDSSSSLAAVGAVPILCGRGDKKTKKGKRFIGSFGNSRPKKEKKMERVKDRVEVPKSIPWPMPFKLI